MAVKIAVDAMGGDYAPAAVVAGAVAAARAGLAEIILVGDTARIEAEFKGQQPPAGLEVVHTAQWVEMGEQPALALRKKKDASIAVATRLVKEGRAAAVVSAGSTGAQMAAALLILGRSGSIQRPAIATALPTLKGPRVLLDIGANVDCSAENLLEFAIMGSLYAERVMGIANPRVGLINIGAEEGKGSEVAQAAHSLLKASGLNFVGNVEGRDLPKGDADVFVCDGFVGNILIKFGEGLGQAVFTRIKAAIGGSLTAKLGSLLLLPALRQLKNEMDYAEYGGAQLLGVQGISIICHGSSDERAIKNAIALAAKCAAGKLVERIGYVNLDAITKAKRGQGCS